MITVSIILTNKRIDLYNIKLILSCLTLTPEPIMVRTGTKTPGEVDRAKEIPPAEAVAIPVAVMETRQ